MYVYSSNSPAYLEYVASTKSRDEILADPNLCKLLENPYLKDNMELALAWQNAKRGGENEKKEFVEYLVCNGPELDADTILFYREKCISEPIYLEIFQKHCSDMTSIDIIRQTKYKKNITDCFTRPCNYLGRFSAVIGMVGDDQNFHTLKNLFSYKRKIIDEKGKEKVEEVLGVDACWGNIRRHLINKIIPDLRVSCQMLYNNMHTKLSSFNESLASAGLGKGIPLGDPYAIPRAKMVSAATKLNVVSQLGDCTKLWQHMRNFNPYDPTKNKKGPVSPANVVGGKNLNGTPTTPVPAASVKQHLSGSTLKKMAAKGDAEAKAILNSDKSYRKCQEDAIAQAEKEAAAAAKRDKMINAALKTAESVKPQIDVKVDIQPPEITPPEISELSEEFLAEVSTHGAFTEASESLLGDITLGAGEDYANDLVQQGAEVLNERNYGDPNKSVYAMVQKANSDM